jgi:hypothetical protein
LEHRVVDQSSGDILAMDSGHTLSWRVPVVPWVAESESKSCPAGKADFNVRKFWYRSMPAD